MLIQLATVALNHDPNQAAVDALNIRLDRAQAAPDWVAGSTGSAAAYTLAPAAGRPLTIAAQFIFSGTPMLTTGAASVLVRAQPTDATAVLGSVDPTPVVVPPGAGARTPAILFPLSNVSIWARGIGRYQVSWRWQVQLLPNTAWIDFDRSDHTIYVTLDTPGAPWSQLTDAANLPRSPWTSALDLACTWAAGVKITTTLATARGHAARAIENAIYHLGRPDTVSRPGAVPTLYQADSEWVAETNDGSIFAFSDFVQLANGKAPSGRTAAMNCTDCASAVVTFANLLGCNLEIRHISPKAAALFKTNAVVPIGDDPANAGSQKFGYHQVAVRPGAKAETDHVHDACLRIDRDKAPFNIASGDYRLSDGLARGAFAKATAKHYKYVHRLINPDHVANCQVEAYEIPSLDTAAATLVPVVSAPVQNLWNEYILEMSHLAPPPVVDVAITVQLDPIDVPNFVAYDRVLNPPRLALLRGLIDQSAEFYYVSTADAKGPNAEDRRLRIAVGYASTSSRARRALAWMLTGSAVPPRSFAHGRSGVVGDLAFLLPNNAGAYSLRGNAIVRVMNVGRQAVPLAPVMNAVIGALTEHD